MARTKIGVGVVDVSPAVICAPNPPILPDGAGVLTGDTGAVVVVSVVLLKMEYRLRVREGLHPDGVVAGSVVGGSAGCFVASVVSGLVVDVPAGSGAGVVVVVVVFVVPGPDVGSHAGGFPLPSQ